MFNLKMLFVFACAMFVCSMGQAQEPPVGPPQPYSIPGFFAEGEHASDPMEALSEAFDAAWAAVPTIQGTLPPGHKIVDIVGTDVSYENVYDSNNNLINIICTIEFSVIVLPDS